MANNPWQSQPQLVQSSGAGILLTPNSLYPQSTFLGLPAASANANVIYNVTDIGQNGSLWQSDGTVWRLMFAVTMMALSPANNSITGTTNETTFTNASLTLPANVMANNQIRTSAHFNYTGNTNTKTIRVWLGGTSFTNISDATASDTNSWLRANIANRGSTNVQIATSSIVATAQVGGLMATSGTENIAGSLIYKITGQLGTSTDTITLQSALVELMPGN